MSRRQESKVSERLSGSTGVRVARNWNRIHAVPSMRPRLPPKGNGSRGNTLTVERAEGSSPPPLNTSSSSCRVNIK